jgi:hypothetical protein
MDQITENGLRVWGRFGDRARELINPNSLKRGSLHHRRGTFSIPSRDGDPKVFNDLHFNEAEVREIWPKSGHRA